MMTAKESRLLLLSEMVTTIDPSVRDEAVADAIDEMEKIIAYWGDKAKKRNLSKGKTP